MNSMILGFVVLLAVSSANAGVAYLPEQHEGYQTPFLPIPAPQVSGAGYEAAEPLPLAQPYQATPIQVAPHQLPPHQDASLQTAQYQASAHYEVAPIATKITVPQHIQQAVPPQPNVQLQKIIIKHIKVPYPVDKYIKVDRKVPYYVDRHYKVDRPYEVVKYIQKPYIVKVERKVHVPIIAKVPVPQPIVQVEPIMAAPIHAHAHELNKRHRRW